MFEGSDALAYRMPRALKPALSRRGIGPPFPSPRHLRAKKLTLRLDTLGTPRLLQTEVGSKVEEGPTRPKEPVNPEKEPARSAT